MFPVGCTHARDVFGFSWKILNFEIWVGARDTDRIVAGHTFRNLPKPKTLVLLTGGGGEVTDDGPAWGWQGYCCCCDDMGVVADFNLRLPAFRMMLLEDITVDLLVAANTSTPRRRGRQQLESGGGKAAAAIGKAEEVRRWWRPDMRRR
jgi:hypothetical protein